MHFLSTSPNTINIIRKHCDEKHCHLQSIRTILILKPLYGECSKVLPFLWSPAQQLVLLGANSERRTRNILILNSSRLHLREDNKPSSYCWSWGGRQGSPGRGWSLRSASQSWRCRRRTCEPRGRATQTAGLSPSWRSGRPEQFLLWKGTFWICHLSKLAFCQNQHNQ